MRIELSFTDYSETDIGKNVEHKDVTDIKKMDTSHMMVFPKAGVIPKIYDLRKIADIRLVVCED